MKRFLSIALALLMLCASSVTIYADANNWGGSAPAGYMVMSDYAINIPEYIDLNMEYRFTAEYLNIRPDEQVDVCITNLTEGRLPMTDGNGNTAYIRIAGTEDDRIAIFRDNLESDIGFWGEGENLRAGDYSGTVEFTFQLSPRG